MEALTAVAVAGLAVIDMVKAVDPARRAHRRPGRARRGRQDRPWVASGREAAVVSVSNRAAAGVYADTSGPLLAEGLAELGFEVDRSAGRAGRRAGRRRAARGRRRRRRRGADHRRHRDHADRPHPRGDPRALDREIPGIAEAIRAYGWRTGTDRALSRGLAGVAGRDADRQPARLARRREGRARRTGAVAGHAVEQSPAATMCRPDTD